LLAVIYVLTVYNFIVRYSETSRKRTVWEQYKIEPLWSPL